MIWTDDEMRELYISFPRPDYPNCMPRVRSGKHGFPDMTLQQNVIGYSHQHFAHYVHANILKQYRESNAIAEEKAIKSRIEKEHALRGFEFLVSMLPEDCTAGFVADARKIIAGEELTK